jgi:hypothetical protein
MLFFVFKINPHRLTLCATLCLHSLAAHSQTAGSELAGNSAAWHMLSPSGYTGAINTPTAAVQSWGAANMAWTNSNPEYARSLQNGHFGSLNLGIGLLPGLEVVGRLAFEGDLNCNLYRADCGGGARDLSLNAKYQLPITLGQHTRFAVGMTDFGGAATNFRQTYGVATTQWQNAELSLGYSHAHSNRALLQGVFGSARFAISPQLHLVAEDDTQERRAGVQFQYPVGDRSSLQAGFSRKWSNNTGQEANQLQLAWVLHMDRSTPRPVTKFVNPAYTVTAGKAVNTATVASTASASTSASPALTSPITAVPLTTTTPAPKATAQSMAQALEKLGYANVKVDYWPTNAANPGLWQISAESRTYRQSQIEALGRALAPWLAGVRQNSVPGTDQIVMTLTYQRQPVLHAFAQANCLAAWAQGSPAAASANCNPTEPLTISRTPIAQAKALQTQREKQGPSHIAQASAGPSWAPQLTLSPAVRNTLGTEYGLVDYSLAAQMGAEVALAPGLFWQGVYLVPISNSDDFERGKVFGDRRFAKNQWHSSHLTYWTPLPWGLSGQVSLGQLAPGQTGAQWDTLWMNPDGRVRLGLTGARYRNDETGREQLPLFATARYSIIPGAWHAEATAGQFMNGDRGYQVASVHWAGDTRVALQYQKTGDSRQPNMPQRAFASFNVSFPFGPKAAVPIGPVWLRAQDQWRWGVQTKVGESNNNLTTGYGETPRQRHGLWTDVTDHDRNGQADLQAQLPRLKAILATTN